MQRFQTTVRLEVQHRTAVTSRQRHRTAHLRQGDLTAACGPLALLMGLIVLGVVTKTEARTLPWEAETVRLAKLWQGMQERFFAGSDLTDLLALLRFMEPRVRHRSVTGGMRRVLAFTQERLAENDLVVLGFGDKGAPGPRHWALAVGTETTVTASKSAFTSVLCLDAAEVAPTIIPFNARLELDSPRRGAGQLHYRGADGRSLLVTCSSAIALSTRAT